MFERAKTVDNTDSADTINKQFVSNPFTFKKKKDFPDLISKKVQELGSCQDQNLKSEKISEIMDYINRLSGQELINFMSNENELIRSLAARSFVDNLPESSINKLEFMLKDESELIRDSAVMALSYLNSNEALDLLNEATKDKLNSIKIKAIAGIADIASECSNSKAKEILESFLNDDNAEIRQFAADELSFLN
jgi:Mg/Co/Ni transporter MgtE